MDYKLNVLYLINYAGGGGSEKYIKILIDNLKDSVNPILVYNEEGLLVKELEERNIKCIKLKMRSPFDFKAARDLAKICKENDIDIIHSNYLRENYISILAKHYRHKFKIVYTCHFNTYDSFIVKMFNKIFYKKLDEVISISNETTKSLIASGTDEEKIKLIYHGVSEKDKVAPMTYAKEKFGLTDDTLTITCGSRFSPEKGNEFLIKSIKALDDKLTKENKNIKYKVLLANEGITLEDCKTLVDILELKDKVEFVGYQKDMEDFYLASDIYVTPSMSEGLGLATLESLSYGIPNVVTKIGGLTEIVNEETNCGLQVTYDNEIELSEALYKLLTDDDFRNSLKENAKKTVSEKFSLSNMIKETFNAYDEPLRTIF